MRALWAGFRSMLASGFPKIGRVPSGGPSIRIIASWVYFGVPLFWESTTQCLNSIPVEANSE